MNSHRFQVPCLPPQASQASSWEGPRATLAVMSSPTETGPPVSPTFADAWELWLAHRRGGTRPLRDSTLADYRSIYRVHLGPALGALPLAAIDGAVVAHLTIAIAGSGCSAKRLSNILVPLRACLRWHHRIGGFAPDPSPWFELSAPAADARRILTPAEIERLLDALPPRHRPMIAFAAYTGVRAGELRALTWSDVDLAARTARIDKSYYRDRLQHTTKSGKPRTVPLPRHIAEILETWRTECPASSANLVFPGPRGGPLDLDTFRARAFKPALERAGLPPTIRIHDLRHTSASLYLHTGATIREVMEIHGWSQMQTALRYLHVSGSLLEAADRLSDAHSRVRNRSSASST